MYKKIFGNSGINALERSKISQIVEQSLWKLSLDHRMIAIDIKKNEFKNKINALIKDKNF